MSGSWRPSREVENWLHLLPTRSANSAAPVLADPPNVARYRDRSDHTVQNNDNDRWLIPAFPELCRVLANRSFSISFYRLRFTSHKLHSTQKPLGVLQPLIAFFSQSGDLLLVLSPALAPPCWQCSLATR